MKNFFPLLRAVALLAATFWLLPFATRSVAADSLSVTPTPGRDLVATAVSSTEIALTWTATPHDFTYAITRMGPDGQPHSLGSVGRTSAFHDRALEPDTTYTYLIRAQSGIAAQDEFMIATAHTRGWQDQDIGQVGAAGSVQRAGDFITVTGSGADIDGGADAFHFVAQPWSGDGELIVRVNSVANTAPWAKAGIMFRESLAPGSRYVMLAANPNGNSALLSRATSDGATQVTISAYADTPQWLKLVRQGSTFQAFQSHDGVRWGFVGSVTVDTRCGLRGTRRHQPRCRRALRRGVRRFQSLGAMGYRHAHGSKSDHEQRDQPNRCGLEQCLRRVLPGRDLAR
ncbi:MAG TPA: hypothetical protein VHD62_19235 [Opitutaceae bacterium]|nr:hypothetical protein [Opitutaceae bacterium]